MNRLPNLSDYALTLDPRDNVATALVDIPPGAYRIGCAKNAGALDVPEAIPAGFKVALAGIPQGGPVLKYGYGIGRATSDIRPGQRVHTHNLASGV